MTRPAGGTDVTAGAASPPGAVRRRIGTAGGWLLRVLLAAVFLGAGAAKLGGDPAMVEMFDAIGVGQGLRYGVGALEVSGAVGLLAPRMARAAATGLALLMIGATTVNVAVLDASPVLPLVLGLAAATTALLLRGRARPGAATELRNRHRRAGPTVVGRANARSGTRLVRSPGA